MSLKDLVDGAAGAIGSAASGAATPVEPNAERSALLDKLRAARAAFEGDRPTEAGGQWLAADDTGYVAFTPTRPDGQQMVIGGQAVTFWQAEDLPAMLDAFEAAISAGELDPQLTGSTPAGHSLPLERLAKR
ncbi:hypothetical protein LPN01_07525 [Sphingomonas sp. A2-49]|uniref:hypothetical protein n=1 Tax=Sphingomonas sp. A2-49 TaxID=1391375 RepID=UPI0021CE94B5|nr:hypothetical protein [Sphingomonas sp. A2-49]MCU6453924.1 hypothetical protein [Sphingomonas sp. A2-49]